MGEDRIRARFERLTDFLARIPPVETDHTPTHGIARGEANGQWWVQFHLDIEHDLSWHVVQELACVLNYLSLEERLPTVFKPVSPAPHLNGGPDEFLSWVIECPSTMSPDTVAEWLEGRLPKPVEDEGAWFGEEGDGDDADTDDDGPTGWIDDEDDE